ncbi:MAG: large subunit ribosomal protein L3 [Candidatus Saganbacteria bacterium]|uniref:50S ribosomal protein L3 n=1 Tax=Candidatus Saganbacteria bacterium TaxID=2575572 RepID=A0A833L1C0_UNCSA|nr:MAG: large subunit ribosomal protein L3 [Candidatus Saganbacteria bacterium]
MMLGYKKGMTQIYLDNGDLAPVTIVEAGPCFVSQVKEKSIQVGFGKTKHVNKPKSGHLKELKLKHLKEFKVSKPEEYKIGQEINVEFFKIGDIVKVRGKSIGKGFAGTVKRWHFTRGPMSHGSKHHRLPGSIGAGTTPGRVEKGTRMSGRMGNRFITVKGLKILRIDKDNNIVMISGAVPGSNNNLLEIYKQ